MGYWGEFVVVRSERSARELDPLNGGLCRRGHEDCLGSERAYGDAWQIVPVEHGVPGETAETVRRLGEQTGAPALICYVLDSDAGLVHGWSARGGPWQTWFRPQYAAEYELPVDLCYEDETGMPATAYTAAWNAEHDRLVREMPGHARRVAAWAVEAGWSPDVDAVHHALIHDEPGWAEEQFHRQLLAAMGAPAPVAHGSLLVHHRRTVEGGRGAQST
ncbi:hypothetical protein [Streptodolium elevatio]